MSTILRKFAVVLLCLAFLVPIAHGRRVQSAVGRLQGRGSSVGQMPEAAEKEMEQEGGGAPADPGKAVGAEEHGEETSPEEDQLQLKRIRQDIVDRSAFIEELARKASELSKGDAPSEMTELEKAMAEVEHVQEEASDLGEHLNQDKASLDNLSDLSDEDVQASETARADVNALAEKIDIAKSSLADFQQKLGRMQINQVKHKVDERTAPIQELTDKVAQWSEGEVPSEVGQLQEALTVVEQTQKGALDLEEHLVKDKLALDQMSGLSDEDTQAQEAIVTNVDALTEKVDGAKSWLASFQQRLEGKIKIEQVNQNIDDRTAPIHDLASRVSQWKDSEVPSEMAHLEEALDAVEKAQKGALYFGEYIVQDMIALDQLSGLSEEDRQARKTAIMNMNALADKVDGAKNNLAALHDKVASKMKEVDQREQDLAAEAERSRHKATARRAQEIQDAATSIIRMVLNSPPPGKDFWSRRRLRLEFHLEEQDGVYHILASTPGLSTDDFKVQPSRDGMVLTVRGICTPDEEQSELMRQEIGQYLQRVAQANPQQLAHGVDASALYAELGEGEFGEFLEKIRLPRDADVNGMRLTYDAGILRIMLPRIPRRSPFQGSPWW